MLSINQIQKFYGNGYVYPVSLFTQIELSSLQKWYYHAIKRFADREYLGLHTMDGFIVDFIQSTPVVQVAEEIYGDRVYLLGSRGFPKNSVEDGEVSEYYAWHQDAATWGIRPAHTLSVWCALTESTEQNGCIQVLPGSHLGPILPYSLGTCEDGNMLCIDQEADRTRIDESLAVPMSLAEGQCSIHDSRILHYSGYNYSDKERQGISWIFVPAYATFSDSWGATLMENKYERIG